MAKPTGKVTPENRLETWRKLWATPRLLTDEEAEAAFEEFQAALVPSHMRNRFVKQFGVPKAVFGNRYFAESAVFHGWNTKFTSLGAREGSHVEVTVIYASPDNLEAHYLRGQSRRTLRDVFVDDWSAACAIVRAEHMAFYVFIEPKMRGCIVFGEAKPPATG